MRPISRRRALQLGGAGFAATVVGGAGLGWEATSRFDPVPGGRLAEPSAVRSVDGALDLRLEVSEGRARVAGRTATVLRYNGGVPGPTLRLNPGDRLRVELVNRLAAPTNLHVHGLHVSPAGNGDNVLVTVEPGGSRRYDYRLPDDHPPGVFWYHPHHHETVADQVFGGLYGAILVADRQTLPVTRERVLVVSDISLDGGGKVHSVSAAARMMGREGDLVLVNGALRPQLSTRPGARERWRIVNACVSRYLRLALDGQQLQLLGLDSGRFQRPAEVREVLLAPGNRADLQVTTATGTSQLRALPYDRGAVMGMGAMGGSSASSTATVELATLTVGGAAAPTLPALPTQPAPRDLRQATVAGHRELILGGGMGMEMGGGGMRFTVDGRSFDPGRVDQSVRLGTVEEWTLTNNSSMDHPLHLHVWPMQVVQSHGEPVDPPAWQDVVNVPARGHTTIRVAFDDFPGRTVYHCHILDHEDKGMMGIIDAR